MSTENGKYYNKAIAATAEEHNNILLQQHVLCYASGKPRPKFVNTKLTKNSYTVFNLGGTKQKKKPEDEQWVKDLQMYKKQSPEELARQKQILDEHKETTEELLELLEELSDAEDDIGEIRSGLQEKNEKYYCYLEQEDKQIAARNGITDMEAINKLKHDAEGRLKEMRH